MRRKDKSSHSFRVRRRISIYIFNNIIYTLHSHKSIVRPGRSGVRQKNQNKHCVHTHEKPFLTAFQTSPLECLFLVFPLERECITEPICRVDIIICDSSSSPLPIILFLHLKKDQETLPPPHTART